MNEMLDDLDPGDAYQAWIERKRARDAEAPEIEVKPIFTEKEANLLAALIEKTVAQFAPEVRLTLNSALAKIDLEMERAKAAV